MHVLVLGGSGFIGSALIKLLISNGYSICCTTRGASRRNEHLEWVQWDGVSGQALVPLLEGAGVVINLLGENIAAQRWTKVQKERIRQSRIRGGEAVTQAFLLCKSAGIILPSTLIQASACGYYGLWADANYTPCCTEDADAGKGFLAETCVAWEGSTMAVESLGVRRCVLRTAPVLGPDGGFLRKMLPAFRACLGGVLGSGKQAMSWVHVQDAVTAILHIVENTALTGPINVSSPHPVTMHEFVATLGKVLHRPTALNVPGFVLDFFLGQMARELLLTGQKVVPARLQASGFIFEYPQLEGALRQILQRESA